MDGFLRASSNDVLPSQLDAAVGSLPVPQSGMRGSLDGRYGEDGSAQSLHLRTAGWTLSRTMLREFRSYFAP